MKKTALICIALLCIITSCKKSNSSGSNYHVTATIGGTAQTFNVSPLATIISNSGYELIAIEGFSSSSSSTQSLALSWNNNVLNQSFGAATYSDTASNYGIIATYVPAFSQSYVGGSGIEATAIGTGVTIANHLKIVITAVDSTHVKGTFSGDTYYQGDISGNVKTITNGDFDVPWKK